MSGFAPPPPEEPRPFHIGRGFHGHETENACPCKQQDCGLIDERDISDECDQHAIKRAKTIRQMHRADECFVCGVTAILDEYLSDMTLLDGAGNTKHWSWRDPDWDASFFALTQTTALLQMAVYLRARYPVVRD